MICASIMHCFDVLFNQVTFKENVHHAANYVEESLNLDLKFFMAKKVSKAPEVST